MKTFTIIAGVNGVGKSSFTGVLKEMRSDLGQIIDPDKLTADYGGNATAAGKMAVKVILDAISSGVSFSQETTLSGSFIKKVVRTAKEKGYFIRLFYVGLDSSDESIERIKNRVKKGGHGIPTDDVRKRYSKRFEDLKAVLPYCDEAFFYDNENGFNKVGKYRNGELHSKGNTVPPWFSELFNM